jgi:hypothetical protein
MSRGLPRREVNLRPRRSARLQALRWRLSRNLRLMLSGGVTRHLRDLQACPGVLRDVTVLPRPRPRNPRSQSTDLKQVTAVASAGYGFQRKAVMAVIAQIVGSTRTFILVPAWSASKPSSTTSSRAIDVTQLLVS